VYNRDVVSTLLAISNAYFKFASKHRKFYRLQLSMRFAPLESEAFKAVSLINMKQHELLEAFFLRAAEDHGNLKGRPRTYAATFLGMLNTYIALALNGYTDLDADLARIVVHQFMHGIFS
jgi:TetR/AcrR family transcriptional regulator